MSVITSAVKRVSSGFSRPADTTAYASGDLVANDTTAINVIPMAFSVGRGGFRITNCRLEKSGTTVTNATFRVHFWESRPTMANGDNGVISNNAANYIGYVDMPAMKATTNSGEAVRHSGEASSWMGGTASGLFGSASSTYIYAVIEARASYTPASGETFTVSLTVEKF